MALRKILNWFEEYVTDYMRQNMVMSEMPKVTHSLARNCIETNFICTLDERYSCCCKKWIQVFADDTVIYITSNILYLTI